MTTREVELIQGEDPFAAINAVDRRVLSDEELVIEDGIPMPRQTSGERGRWEKLFLSMKVGQSIPCTLATYRLMYAASLRHKTFTLRMAQMSAEDKAKHPGCTTRVWRVS